MFRPEHPRMLAQGVLAISLVVRIYDGYGVPNHHLEQARAAVERIMTTEAGMDEGELLGRVIAHEIAHLLLGTNSHSDRGLMRGGWKASELARQPKSEWGLSRSEGIAIRRALWRRVSASPPALMADIDNASDLTAQ